MCLDNLEFAIQSFRSRDFEKHSFISDANKSQAVLKKSKHPSFHEHKAMNTKEVKTVVDKLNKFTDPVKTNLQFKYHEELNEYYVRVINPLTNEIIKEIPPKKKLDMFAEMVGQIGVLVDEKV